MTLPLVSCVVPVYNGERFVAEAIESILAQSYRPTEIVVVDDGSTDRTAEVLARYADRVVLRLQPNAGPAAARNLGLRVARGEFVAFLDADDLWHPDKLSRQLARFDARPELDACTGHIQYHWAAELREEAEQFRNHPLARPLPSYMLQTLVARRRVFDAVGSLNEALRIGEDTEWIMRALDEGIVFEVLPDVVTYRRLHADNLTRRAPNALRDGFFRLAKRHLERQRRLAREGGGDRAPRESEATGESKRPPP